MLTRFGEINSLLLSSVPGQHDDNSWMFIVLGRVQDKQKGNVYKEVHNLLLHLPSLQVLQLRFQFLRPPLSQELIHVLCTSESESPPFLPHLQYLDLYFQVNFPWIWEWIPRILTNSPHDP